MRLYPSQLAVQLICGQPMPMGRDKGLIDRMRQGHDLLVSITHRDYGYDLLAWHNHLKESREGGYTYGRNIVVPKIMQEAMDSEDWRVAAKKLTARLSKQKERKSSP